MDPSIQQVYQRDESSHRFIPFRERRTHWGDDQVRPMIPNVATVIPPNVDPALLKLLLRRMKVEEVTYKLRHLDDHDTDLIWLENNLEAHIFNSRREAVQGRARECAGFELRSLVNEIDNAYPPILPTPLKLVVSEREARKHRRATMAQMSEIDQKQINKTRLQNTGFQPRMQGPLIPPEAILTPNFQNPIPGIPQNLEQNQPRPLDLGPPPISPPNLYHNPKAHNRHNSTL